MKDPRSRRLFIVGLLVTIAVAVGLAQVSSSDPDGLEYVAEQEGFATDAEGGSGPLADYGDDLTRRSWVNTAVAGLVGTLATLAIGYGIFRLARAAQRGESDRPAGEH
jgi:hypothetical protein